MRGDITVYFTSGYCYFPCGFILFISDSRPGRPLLWYEGQDCLYILEVALLRILDIHAAKNTKSQTPLTCFASLFYNHDI